MSLNQTIADERREVMIRYLLGALTEEEQNSVEQAYFADREQFEQIRAAENELVDDYVRNRMPPRERELFERNYLKSPKHRERVAFAGLLLKAADQTAAAPVTQSEPAGSWWSRLLESLRGPQLVFAGAMAAAMLVLTIGAAWLLIERSRLNDQLAREQAGRLTHQQREQELSRQIQELEKQMTGERQQSEQASAELARLREALRKAQAPPPAPPPVSQPMLLSFLLLPGGVRAGGEAQQLALPPRVSQVQLRVKTETSDYQSFQVKIRAVDGAEIFSRQSIRPRSGKPRSGEVVVSIPAARLITNDYILTLSGVTATGETEEISRSFFRITRR